MNVDMLDSPGTRIKERLNAIVWENETIRCLRDQIVVEPLGWTPSKLIIVAYQGEPLRGIVRAVGPGRYLIQYASGTPPVWYPTHHPPAKGKRTASRESTIFRPCELKLGDTVEFGGLELKGFLHRTIIWQGKEMVLAREEDVCGVVQSEAA